MNSLTTPASRWPGSHFLTIFADQGTGSCVAVSAADVYLRVIGGGMFAAHHNGVNMTRIILIGLAVVGMALPAYAAESSSSTGAAGVSAELGKAANEQEARVQLAHQGYTAISPLYKDELGRWIGTAYKDGRTVIVALAMPHAPQRGEALTD